MSKPPKEKTRQQIILLCDKPWLARGFWESLKFRHGVTYHAATLQNTLAKRAALRFHPTFVVDAGCLERFGFGKNMNSDDSVFQATF
jgi:hypothetical protein